MMRRIPTFIAVAASAAALAACGSTTPVADPTSTAPSTPTTPSSSAPAKLAPPVMPAAAKAHTKAGAIAFVRHVVATLNFAQTTLDPAPLKTLFSEGCSGCRAAVKLLDDLRKHGGSITGGGQAIRHPHVVIARPDPHALFVVDFDIANERQTVDNGRGKETVYLPSTAHDRWYLSGATDGWTVVTWDVS